MTAETRVPFTDIVNRLQIKNSKGKFKDAFDMELMLYHWHRTNLITESDYLKMRDKLKQFNDDVEIFVNHYKNRATA